MAVDSAELLAGSTTIPKRWLKWYKPKSDNEGRVIVQAVRLPMMPRDDELS